MQPDGCIKDLCGLECRVRDINNGAIALTEALIQFNTLFEQAQSANCSTAELAGVTLQSQKATRAIREFKTAATEGLLACRIKSIILPLLSDHVLREANHYFRLLNMCEASVDCCER